MDEMALLRIMKRTQDPTVLLDGEPVPAMTTMLHRVCGNDETKYDEALRLVGLFMREMLKEPTP